MTHPTVIRAFVILSLTLVLAIGGKAAVEAWRPKDDCAAPGSQGRTVSVLFVGNSLTAGVPVRLRHLLDCAGFDRKVGVIWKPNYKLEEHNRLPETLDLLANGYGTVVLQEQSRGIHHYHRPPYPVLAALMDKVRAAGSAPLLYQTWGYKNSTPEPVMAGYEAAGVHLNATVAAVGRAWWTYRDYHKTLLAFDLYKDENHASKHGMALAAYVFYAYLTGESPVGRARLDLPPDDARLLQEIAWQTYRDYR